MGLATLDGITPLHEACVGGHFTCAKLLLEHGADVRTVTILHSIFRHFSEEVFTLTLHNELKHVLCFRQMLFLLMETLLSLVPAVVGTPPSSVSS